MNEKTNIKKAYFLGIGGIGMSALARYFKFYGVSVTGYDKTPSELTDQLQAEGITIHFDENTGSTPTDADLYVYTPAIPAEHCAFAHVRAFGGVWRKRSEVLGDISKTMRTLAVAGTHGKTTTSAIVSHLLQSAHEPVVAFVGGIMANYGTNLLLSPAPTYLVAEADEYDRSFLRLNPEIGIITSMDPDHLDIYGTSESMAKDYEAFAALCGSVLVRDSISDRIVHPRLISFGTSVTAGYRCENYRMEAGYFMFDLQGRGLEINDLEMVMPGEHNALNATAALALCLELGLSAEALRSGLRSFIGVHRRFESVLRLPHLALTDDYAHHPAEIEAAIKAARLLFPLRKLTVVFQPHLYSRTRDLEDGFVESLSLADQVVLLPIYPARELPIPGIDSARLLKRLPLKTTLLVEKSDLVNAVLSLSPENVLTLGAGDIDRLVKPLANKLKENANAQ